MTAFLSLLSTFLLEHHANTPKESRKLTRGQPIRDPLALLHSFALLDFSLLVW